MLFRSGDQNVLVISFIGYVTKEVSIGSQSTVDVSIDPDVQTLTELVVTGYGVDKRRELTGAVSTIKPKDVLFAPTGNVEQMLQGRVAGDLCLDNNLQLRVSARRFNHRSDLLQLLGGDVSFRNK